MQLVMFTLNNYYYVLIWKVLFVPLQMYEGRPLQTCLAGTPVLDLGSQSSSRGHRSWIMGASSQVFTNSLHAKKTHALQFLLL